MQQAQIPVVFTRQTVAVPAGVLGSSFAVAVVDVEACSTDLREGFVTINGRRGLVVQSYPPCCDGDAAFFLFRWLDQPDVSVWW